MYSNVNLIEGNYYSWTDHGRRKYESDWLSRYTFSVDIEVAIETISNKLGGVLGGIDWEDHYLFFGGGSKSIRSLLVIEERITSKFRPP